MFGVGSFVTLTTAIGFSSIGGIVTFAPASYTVQRTELPTSVTLDLIVSTQQLLPDGVTPQPIQEFDLVPIWDRRLYPFSGSYGPPFPPNLRFVPFGPFICGIADCFLEYFLVFSPPIPSPVRAGSMTLGLPIDLPEGNYRVFVDSAYDQFSSLNVEEGVFGEAFIHVVPEPATLALLACGVAAMALSARRFFFRV